MRRGGTLSLNVPRWQRSLQGRSEVSARKRSPMISTCWSPAAMSASFSASVSGLIGPGQMNSAANRRSRTASADAAAVLNDMTKGHDRRWRGVLTFLESSMRFPCVGGGSCGQGLR
jgi:hypothetical protein